MAIGRVNTGGSGSGGTLTVTGIAGHTVTATKDGKTYTRTFNSGGVAVFKGLSTGTWTLTMAGGGQTATRTVTVNADYAVTITYFSATISITYPANSNCVVANSGGQTVASDTNTGTAAKTWTATVNAKGTYTVTATATDGSGKKKSTTVSITANGQVETVTLNYEFYLFNKGKVSGIDWEVVDYKDGFASVSIGTTITGTTSGSGGDVYQGWSVSSTTKIDVSRYTKLCANVTNVTPNDLFLGIDISKKVEAGYDDLQAHAIITQKGVVSVDISSINTSGYIGLGRNWWKMSASQLTVDQIWLE